MHQTIRKQLDTARSSTLARWECNCGTHTRVNTTTHVVEQHSTPAGNYCPMSCGEVNPTAVQLWELCSAPHPDAPAVLCNLYRLGHRAARPGVTVEQHDDGQGVTW